VTNQPPRSDQHGRPQRIPSIGSPTLLWHLGVWRKRARGHGEANPHDFYIGDYEGYNALFHKEIFDFPACTATARSLSGDLVDPAKPEPMAIEGMANDGIDVLSSVAGTRPWRRLFGHTTASWSRGSGSQRRHRNHPLHFLRRIARARQIFSFPAIEHRFNADTQSPRYRAPHLE
jgi:hypothetical protein